MSEPFTFKDNRRIDPQTGAVRESHSAPEPPVVETYGDPAETTETEIVAEEESVAEAVAVASETAESVEPSETEKLERLVAERTEDLQRLQAEYQNYKRRVDRDRALAKASGVEAVILDLVPVLDSVAAARAHGELDGGFKLVVDELERIVAKYELQVFGEVGEAFDPAIHEALLQLPHSEPVEVPTVSQVMQSGMKLKDRVLRPARVAVAEPEA